MDTKEGYEATRQRVSESTLSTGSTIGGEFGPQAGVVQMRAVLRGRSYDEQVGMLTPVQAKGDVGGNVHVLAAKGMAGAGGRLPYHESIQASFGNHDVSSVQAHASAQASAACNAMGAEAYASGDHVAFGSAPDLHTAAHEAAHVVQQRAGVSLSGGVGRAGDAYEQQADAVADAVVAGKSAESLLGTSSDGGAANVQRKSVQMKGPGPDGPVAAPKSAGAGVPNQGAQAFVDDRALEDKLTAVAAAYKYICLKQRDAVNDLSIDAGKTDPPPLWQSLLLACGEIALAAALGGVGGAVAIGVTKKLGKVLLGPDKALIENTIRVVADAMKDAAKQTGKELIKGAHSVVAGSSKDPREIFFRSQRDTLTDTAARQEQDFITKQKAQVRKGPHALAQAEALLDAINSEYNNAYLTQRNETLDQWCTYQAKKELGTTNDKDDGGTTLGKQLGDTSAAGVLGIVLEHLSMPGQKPQIARAEIEGLNEGLRGVIESRKIKDLKMPITVKGNVGHDVPWYSKDPQAYIQIGRNEAGTVFTSTRSWGGLRWLHGRAHPGPEISRPGGPDRKHLEDAAIVGARLVVEKDIADLTVSGKLSG